ncbi:MAG: PucR family transcriptional regulator ligand-binding domain-containing protein [Candidatus Pseudomonas phytovorans]|uniref:PucR family transcriptional regulator ligand-binding domain-containing protein n=1 Tax=Candidatus Pseudomonas phytovorans TaxID=3121377 RepID=A0AAJ6BCH4_9PSED|nr:PucR family transcriptional regulator [Pseudomonas sp.]WEK29661.1 MAG: PucR family transcriptional regulator ligand-binding domain-containing protein [Pseudomonas sp.]
MSFSIQDIIDNVSLRTRLLTGMEGTQRTLRWAHVCELADPSEWLGEGDLLMTTGMGIPREVEQQSAYVTRISDAKVAGMMIGENMQAPDDISGLLDQASLLGFPVLITHYSVPFSAVTKAILDARQQTEDQRRRAVVRLYESARIGLRHLGLNGLLLRLSADVTAELYLFDTRSLCPWQEGLEFLPTRWHEVLSSRARLTYDLTRCHDGDSEALVMALPALPECAILATGGQLLDYGILHHIASVLAIELERVQGEHERMLRLGSELLDDLLNMRLTERAAMDRLEQLSCPPSSSHLVLARLDHAAPNNWQMELSRQSMKMLARQAGDELVILVADPSVCESLQAMLGCSLGVSAVLGAGLRAPEALREARLALAHSTVARKIVDYANALDEAFWLPSDLEQANRMYRGVIGGLADYDAQNGSQLIHTLRVFLEQNRSWQKSSQMLNVHKQTLIYRVRRIEEITGRSLDDTEGVVALWIALRSMDIAVDVQIGAMSATTRLQP